MVVEPDHETYEVLPPNYERISVFNETNCGPVARDRLVEHFGFKEHETDDPVLVHEPSRDRSVRAYATANHSIVTIHYDPELDIETSTLKKGAITQAIHETLSQGETYIDLDGILSGDYTYA